MKRYGINQRGNIVEIVLFGTNTLYIKDLNTGDRKVVHRSTIIIDPLI